MSSRIQICCVYGCLIIVAILTCVYAWPGAEGRRDPCQINAKWMDTCQRCAKITKSPDAYPYCCKDVENAYNWCEKYVYFGKRAKRVDPDYKIAYNPFYKYRTLTSNDI